MMGPNADTTGRVEAMFQSARPLGAADQKLRSFEAMCDDVLDALASDREQSIRSFPPGRHRVLVVEDNVRLLSAYRRMLRDIAYIDVAATVDEARIKLRERAYHVLILDYQLVNGTAADLIRASREQPEQAYAILISARVHGEAGAALARKIGADDWLPKPFSMEELRDRTQRGFSESRFQAASASR